MPDPFRGQGAVRVANETSDIWLTSFVMTNRVEAVCAWVGTNRLRAQRVAALEEQRPKPRAALLTKMREVVDGTSS
jgi:hypothetical protein